MKKIICFWLASLLPITSLAAVDNTHIESNIITYKYSFAKKDNYQVSYADYPAGKEDFYSLTSEQDAKLPVEIKTSMRGLKISGNNHSDDLFMYTYKKLTGLQPNTEYHTRFSLELASNARTDSVGVGGSPGSAVSVKIGVVTEQPERYIDVDGYYRMQLDKGNQSSDGKDMLLLGNVGVETENQTYLLKTLPDRPNDELLEKIARYTVTSNEKGEAWLILGTDSGYESVSTIFYTNVVVELIAIK